MLKKLLATILIILIRIITFIIPLAFIFQTFTKEETLDALLDGIITTMFDNMNYETPDELIIKDYFNKEDLKRYYKHYSKEIIRSYFNNSEIPSLKNEELEKIINDAEIKYKNETGNQLDTSGIYQSIDQSDQEIKKMESRSSNNILKKFMIQGISTRKIIFLILIDIILILLVYFIYKDPISLASFLYRIFITKTIFLVLFSIFIIRNISDIGESFKPFEQIMTKTIDRLAIYMGLITIALYITKTMLSKKKVMPGMNNNQLIYL